MRDDHRSAGSARGDSYDRERLLVGVARGGSAAFAGTAAAAVLGFTLTVVVTRGLSTATAGEFFTATALFLVAQTALTFGVAAGVVRFVPRLRAQGREADVPALLAVAVAPVVLAALLGAVVMWVAAPALAEHFQHGSSASARSTFLLLAVFLPVGALEVVAVECTRAFGSIGRYVLIQQILLPLSRPVLVLVALAADAPLWGVVLAWLLPLAVALSLAGRVVTTGLSEICGSPLPWPERTVPLSALTREYWSFTGARGVANVIDILLTWFDVLLVAALVSPRDAAIYAAASRFITSGTLVMQALRLAISPELSAALARDDQRRAGDMYRVSTQWIVLSSWPLYLAMGVFAPTVLRVFGPAYPHGATAMSVLCAAMLVALAAGNVGSVLLMGGRSTWVLGDKVVALTVNVIGNLLLVPRYGITGAAVAWALTIVIDNALGFCQVRWGMHLSARSRGVGLAAGASLLLYGVGLVGVRSLWGSSPAALIVGTALASAAYAGFAWRQREVLDLPLLAAALRRRTSASTE
jgi:O-antigen/teichoic acid export membrane protein